MALSAAELQKRHGLEGAPDPFPTLGNPKAVSTSNGNGTPKAQAPAASDPVDTSSESAFPSLGASSAPPHNVAKPAVSMWSAKPSAVKSSKFKPSAPGGLGRSGAAIPTATSHPFSDTFSLPANDIATGKIVGETMKKVLEQTGAIVESSTQMKTGLKTFHIKAADQKRLSYARRMIERGLSKVVTTEVEVPITTLGTIIGPKGTTLKSITDATTCKIDIPRRDTLPVYDGKADADSDDESEEPLVAIAITGPSVACGDAKTKILALISHRTSQTTTSIKTIPSSYYPFIAGPKGDKARQLEEGMGEGQVKVHVPPPAVWKALEKQAAGEEEVDDKERDLAIKVKGEKAKVKVIVQEILKQYEELVDNLRELKISIPKRQHRFLVGSAADDILGQTGCIVELTPVDDPSDQCVIRGPQPSLIPALTLVMDKANAIAVEMVDVVALHRPNTSDPLTHAKRVLRYLLRSARLRAIADAHDGVKVFPPFAAVIAASGTVVIEIVGENKAQVVKAKEELVSIVKSVLPSAVESVEIDPIVHALLIGKKGAKIATFESANNVTTVFPPASEESAQVLLIYTGALDALPTEKKARDERLKDILGNASKAIIELAQGAADIKTETMDVDKKWHRFIIGTGGTVLNALIGQDNMVNVKVGSGSGKSQFQANGNAKDADTVVVRGPSDEVDRVVAQIKQIVTDAENDDIVNGHTAEFTVDRRHVPHLVGAAGATINKLRETLGVKVNFDDESDGKKPTKKAVAYCKIVGRKEAVEEAKKRVQAQIEKLEDETTETLTIKRAIQPALIGSGGKYAIRLEEKYGVKLSFPRDGKDGTASAKPDEVTIRGGRKGVAAAKAELLEAAAFESDSRQTASFTVPSKSISMIVGKSGATINGIKDETGAQIDIDKSASQEAKTTVTVRGDKKAIAAAKAAILAVAEQVGDELQTTVTIDPKYHRTLIGQGGQRLRDLVVSCGGPAEAYKQNGLINFPKQGDENLDQVKLRGDSKLVKAIKQELEKQAEILSQTITVGVVVPHSQHATKIGRGGSALQDLQKKTGAVVHFPGSRQYNSVGDVENAQELENAEKADIVKVVGTKEVCAAAAELLSVSSERAPRTDSRGPRNGADLSSKAVSIPIKYHFAIVDQPQLIRTIRSVGGQLIVPSPAPTRAAIARPSTNGHSSSARIDVDQQEEDVEGEWELRENYQGAEDGEKEWIVKAKEDDLEKAVKILEDAISQAKAATHVGALTGLPRSAFPRIIGTKGATISRLRAETGTDIVVGKDDDLITITGDEESVLQAKEAILSIVSRSGGQRY
ncbi:hypothetical protein P7C73_g5402, partial [Tremellales sp. Uapishka_1]